MKLIIVVCALIFSTISYADVYVKGYYKKNGTYVAPHVRSNPDSIKSNNYGSSNSGASAYQRSYESLNPKSKDYDSDGTPNYLDSDDDNDGISDDNE